MPILGQLITIPENMWVSLIGYPELVYHVKPVSCMLVFFLTELIMGNELSLATNLLIVPLKLFLTVLPTVSVPGLMLCIAKSFDKVTQTCEKYIICIRRKVLI